METVGRKHQEGLFQELECRMNLGAGSRSGLPRITENLEVLAFPSWQDKIGRSTSS